MKKIHEKTTGCRRRALLQKPQTGATMAEVTLDRAIALLSSEKVKDRTDGLAGMFGIAYTVYWVPAD